MRALVVGDIHTEDALLAAAIAHARAADVDRLLSVGDIVDGRCEPLAAIALLRQHHFDVVRGNHERWVVEGNPMVPFDYPDDILDWIGELPATREYVTPTGKLLLGHGLGSDDMATFKPETEGYALECLDALWALVRPHRYRWFIGGHTHVPMVRTVEGLTVINPGTLVLEQEPSFMLVDFARAEIEHFTLLPTIRSRERWRL